MPRNPLRRRRLAPQLAVAAVAVAVAALSAAAPSSAVVGGTPAAPGEWPWMAGLLRAELVDAGQAQFCGGVVIAPRRVLTAAHCVALLSSAQIDVLVGRTRLSEPGGRRLDVIGVSVFPGFVSGRQPSLDAAVLELAGDAGVSPLTLAGAGQEAMWAPGTLAWTIGWGALNARPSPGGNQYYADRLRQVQVPMQGDAACENAFGVGFWDYPYRPQWLLCAGTSEGRTGTCYGDSGGPLVVAAPGGWLDVGIVNGGDACAARGYFDLFARVDRISAFALAPSLTPRPENIVPPSLLGRVGAGRTMRCTHGRWRGRPTRFLVRWTRLHDRSGRVLSRRTTYRLTARDARRGVTCSVTGQNAGGRSTTTARPGRAA
jgi:secreted trypsin-like serine protease